MMKKAMMDSNSIGNVKGIDGTSLALNGQMGCGADKPNMGKGMASPGGTKPEKPMDAPVPMPK